MEEADYAGSGVDADLDQETVAVDFCADVVMELFASCSCLCFEEGSQMILVEEVAVAESVIVVVVLGVVPETELGLGLEEALEQMVGMDLGKG